MGLVFFLGNRMVGRMCLIFRSSTKMKRMWVSNSEETYQRVGGMSLVKKEGCVGQEERSNTSLILEIKLEFFDLCKVKLIHLWKSIRIIYALCVWQYGFWNCRHKWISRPARTLNWDFPGSPTSAQCVTDDFCGFAGAFSLHCPH